MDVRAPVIEGREQKCRVNCSHDPVPNSRSNAMLLLQIAQPRFGQIYRTDGADQILVHFLGLIQIIVITGSRHDVISIVKQQDQIVSGMIIGVNDQIIISVQKRLILQLCLPKCHENLLASANLLLFHREFQVQKIVAQRTGQCFIGNLQIFIKLILVQIQKGVSNLAHLIVISVHITAHNSCEGRRFFLKSFFNF